MHKSVILHYWSLTHPLRTLTLLTPAALVMLLCGVVPMGFVAFYSLHDTFGDNSFIWVGLTWFEQILVSPDFSFALAPSLGFSVLVLVLAIEMPARGAHLGALNSAQPPRNGPAYS